MQSRKRNYALPTFTSVAILIALAAGWRLGILSDLGNTDAANSLTEVRFEALTITVEDETGNPVEGAILELTGLQMRGRSHGWSQQEDGPKTYSTDHEGQAIVQYPVEARRANGRPTHSVVLSVDHPDFAFVFRTVFRVNGSTGPIQLTRGMEMEVSGYFGDDRQPVTEIVPTFSRIGRPYQHWVEKENGAIATSRFSPGDYLLQLKGKLPLGETAYSRTLDFTAERGEKRSLTVEMYPAIRLEGRLDDNVRRPVTDGYAFITVFSNPLELEAIAHPTRKYGRFRGWTDHQQIAEDGSFVFESVPPGQVNVYVRGDDFVSINGGEVMDRDEFDEGVRTGAIPEVRVPQTFDLSAPLTRIEVMTEKPRPFLHPTLGGSGPYPNDW